MAEVTQDDKIHHDLGLGGKMAERGRSRGGVVHPIRGASPLRGFTLASLTDSEPEFVCLITADDETFPQTVHAKTSYDKTDVVWGARFRDMYVTDVDHVSIDLRRLHEYERVSAPAVL